jgi:hypothetical protein
MRRAFGAVELLITVVIIIIVYFACFHNPGRQTNPLVDNVNEIKTKQQMVDDKLDEIQQTKMLKERMDRNLNGEY